MKVAHRNALAALGDANERREAAAAAVNTADIALFDALSDPAYYAAALARFQLAERDAIAALATARKQRDAAASAQESAQGARDKAGRAALDARDAFDAAGDAKAKAVYQKALDAERDAKLDLARATRIAEGEAAALADCERTLKRAQVELARLRMGTGRIRAELAPTIAQLLTARRAMVAAALAWLAARRAWGADVAAYQDATGETCGQSFPTLADACRAELSCTPDAELATMTASADRRLSVTGFVADAFGRALGEAYHGHATAHAINALSEGT